MLLQKPRMPQIQGVQGRSRNILLRALGNEGDGASSAFPPGKKHDKFFICFRSHQKFIRELCLNVFKCSVIIIFFYILSCFLCNCRVDSTHIWIMFGANRLLYGFDVSLTFKKSSSSCSLEASEGALVKRHEAF